MKQLFLFQFPKPFIPFLFFLGIILLSSCSKEGSELNKITDGVLSPRSISLGSYSVNSNGILEFPSDSDFHKTVEYIFTDSTGIHLHTFRASLSMKTISKQADIIIDSVENILYYPSKMSSKWSNYSDFVNMTIASGDTAVTHKYGAWGEFLNLQNLVVIQGSLYKITKEKTIIISDGDLGKLDDAEELEESDTTNGIYITPRACACNSTGLEWHEDKQVNTTYNGHRYRATSEETWSNLTTSVKIGGQRRITPHFVYKTFMKIQKKGITWSCHRMHFNWDRQVWVTHDLQLPTSGANYNANSIWYESEGWNNHWECEFQHDKDYKYASYLKTPTWDEPMGYCLGVKIFAQHFATAENPSLSTGWYYYPYPTTDCDEYLENNCWNFEWLYAL